MELLNDEQTAKYIGVKPNTLIAWRNRGEGPHYVRVGRLRRYSKHELDRWLNARTVAPKAKPRRRLRSKR